MQGQMSTHSSDPVRADDAWHAFSHAGHYITCPGSLMEPVAQLECGEGWL